MKVNVLGSEWTIEQRTADEDQYLKTNEGYCDPTSHEIVYEPYPQPRTPSYEAYADPEVANKRIVRHELIHAFLFESGLADAAGWARNETMVDFFARQFPKLMTAMIAAGALEAPKQEENP